MSYIEYTGTMHFIGGAVVNGYLWTNALEWNGYYKLNIETGYVSFLGLFNYADSFADKLFNRVLAYQKFVFFIPWFFDYVVRLDTETLDTRYWMLPENIVCEIAKFRTAYIYDRRIVMFPHVGDDICIFDIEKEEFECCRNWIKELDKYRLENKRNKFLQGFQKKEIVYVPNISDSFIMEYNLGNDSCKIILFAKSEKGIIDVVEFDNDTLLVLTLVGNVWKYYINSNNRELIYKYDGKIESPYGHVIVQQDYFYLIPAEENNIKFFDKGKEKIIPYPDNWKLQHINVGITSIFYGYFRNGNEILLYPCRGNQILKMKLGQSMISDLTVVEDIKYRLEEIIKRIFSHGTQKELLYEQKVNLTLLLSIVTGKEKKTENTEYLEEIGFKTWNIMKGI